MYGSSLEKIKNIFSENNLLDKKLTNQISLMFAASVHGSMPSGAGQLLRLSNTYLKSLKLKELGVRLYGNSKKVGGSYIHIGDNIDAFVEAYNDIENAANLIKDDKLDDSDRRSLNTLLREASRIINYMTVALNSDYRQNDSFDVMLLNENAVLPEKKHVSDSGYDLHVISIDQMPGHDDLYLCDTGVAVRPPIGWDFVLAGRSSLPKKGWQFVGGIGVIDRTYKDSIKAILKKTSDADFPKTPFRALQIVPRRVVHLNMNVTDNIGGSKRGIGGFGSTDKK